MFIYKTYIDAYIKCPHFFGLSVIDKSGLENLPDALKKIYKSKVYKSLDKDLKKNDIDWFRDMVSGIALKEMSTGQKVSVHEYRIMYTNKYHKDVLNVYSSEDSSKTVERLNNVFSLFSDKVFLGYNVPVEIPIKKTSIMYRDMFDFMMCDFEDPENITVIEIDNISDKRQARKYLDWAHYKIQYYFLAESLNTNVNVIIIDPINTDLRINLIYKPRNFDDIHDICSRLVNDVANPVLIKNLFSCQECEYSDTCLKGEDKDVR